MSDNSWRQTILEQRNEHRAQVPTAARNQRLVLQSRERPNRKTIRSARADLAINKEMRPPKPRYDERPHVKPLVRQVRGPQACFQFQETQAKAIWNGYEPQCVKQLAMRRSSAVLRE
jgi:hypothetical protein